MSSEEIRNFFKNITGRFNTITVKELQERYPYINWVILS